MSTPVQPARPDAASMTAIRGLLERNLLERAVTLAETRWPGSGQMVELAHDWAVLSPSARRERLASIGPEELARMRGIAQLQPDLERVLDDLEARGIIPPESVGVTVPDPSATEPPTFEEAVADAAIDYSEQGLQQLAQSAREDLPPNLEAAMETIASATTEAELAEAAAVIARERAAMGLLEPVPMPELDLGLPSTEEFLAEEAAHRQEASDLANSILDRARSQVDQAANNLLPVTQPTTLPQPAAQEQPEPDSRSAETSVDQQSTRVDSTTAPELRDDVERELVLSLEMRTPLPTAAELQSVATATGRDYVAFRPAEMGSRAFFGGLVREGRRVEPQAGAFPTALSTNSLVVVYGRLYPKMIERLREGYCDIPGTQATVRIHPGCRIVLLPD